MKKNTDYKIITKLHQSNSSLVYRALANTGDRSVILKVLKKDYPNPSELTRYRQEYDITRSLDIKGAIAAYDLIPYENTLAIVLEYFEAQSLDRLLQSRSFTLLELLQITMQIAEILDKIHCANIIHKDINPSNILFNLETEQVKIIDFGISSILTKEAPALKNPEVLEGTLAYMSPEQTGRMNRSLDYRTDFYSLGATFYTLLTKRFIFESHDPLELVHCHIARQPIPPHEINPSIPKIISDIVMKLLAKTAEERYQTGLGLKADLEECYTQLEQNGQIAEFPLASRDFVEQLQIPQKLYGRESEIEQLLETFERVTEEGNSSQKRAEMMLVGGFSGIGKTALIQELYRPISQQRGYFISGKFDQFQRNIPYSAVVYALQSLVRQVLTESQAQLNQWRDKLNEALGINGQVIVDVIPEIEQIIGKQPPVQALEPAQAQSRFNLVFQSFIRVFCQKEHPLVIFFDDLQWADFGTLKKIFQRAIAMSGIILTCLLGSNFNFFNESSLPLSRASPMLVSQSFKEPDLFVRANYTPEEATKFAWQTFLTLYDASCSIPPVKDKQVQKGVLYPILLWISYKILHETQSKKSDCVSHLNLIAVTKVMKKSTINMSIFWLALVCYTSLMLLVQSTTEVRAGNLNIPAPQLTFNIPANPSLSIRGTYNTATAFAQLAWQAFVALNWPANCNGVPLSDRSIGQSPSLPRVWEFYPFPQNIFLPDGRDPRPVRSSVPLNCQTDNNLQIWNLRLTEDEEHLMSLLLADRQPLVDREGNYIVNEIRINPVEVNQIVQNRWYAVDNLAEFNNRNNRFALACSNAKKDGLYEGKFPCTENESVGAIEIKAAWKVLPNPILGETNAICDISESRYYKNIRTFRITSDRSTNGSEIVTVPVGLVGFHISQKTSQQGWVWATFEQVDNAPDANGLPSAKNYTLYDRNCTRNCEPNTSYAREPYLWRREYPHAVTRSETGEIVEQIPSQITRLIPIPAIAKSFNTAWQEKLRQVAPDSVWQYYQLVGIQWLESPEVPYTPELKAIQLRQGNQPSMLANTTLEPYVQKGPPLYPFGNSCATCHAQATLPHPNAKTFADFSYLLNDAGDPDRE